MMSVLLKYTFLLSSLSFWQAGARRKAPGVDEQDLLPAERAAADDQHSLPAERAAADDPHQTFSAAGDPQDHLLPARFISHLRADDPHQTFSAAGDPFASEERDLASEVAELQTKLTNFLEDFLKAGDRVGNFSDLNGLWEDLRLYMRDADAFPEGEDLRVKSIKLQEYRQGLYQLLYSLEDLGAELAEGFYEYPGAGFLGLFSARGTGQDQLRERVEEHKKVLFGFWRQGLTEGVDDAHLSELCRVMFLL